MSTSIARPSRSPARASSRSLRRAASATFAPWAASARAVASPMPLLAPVTSATGPSSVMPAWSQLPPRAPGLALERGLDGHGPVLAQLEGDGRTAVGADRLRALDGLAALELDGERRPA